MPISSTQTLSPRWLGSLATWVPPSYGRFGHCHCMGLSTTTKCCCISQISVISGAPPVDLCEGCVHTSGLWENRLLALGMSKSLTKDSSRRMGDNEEEIAGHLLRPGLLFNTLFLDFHLSCPSQYQGRTVQLYSVLTSHHPRRPTPNGAGNNDYLFAYCHDTTCAVFSVRLCFSSYCNLCPSGMHADGRCRF